MKIYSEVKEIMVEGYISTENMTMGYGRVPLIEQIGLHVRWGEIVAPVEPNDAGKSTILKNVIRQLGLFGGTVYLDGQSMKGMTEKRIAKRMSTLMTERICPELMACRGVVGTGRYPYTGRLGVLTAADHKKMREAMELVHAGELTDRDFMEISDGQKQRILLARAICQEPETIALDEPTSFLDIRYKLEPLTILKDLVYEKRMTMLMSLHELDLVRKLSDFVVCVRGDAIKRCGTPEEIFVSSYIKELYDTTKGNHHAGMGCLEVGPVKGESRIFVIGGDRSGIPIYRRLQRQGIPFAAGILHENDMDYPVAKAPASEVISETPFGPVRDATHERIVSMLKSYEQVICCLSGFGTLNEKNRELTEARTCLKDLGRI